MASKLTPAQRVALARHPERPGTADFIKHLFTDFFEQRGDRLCAENGSILGGVALFHGKPVTVIGHRKGRSLEENLSLPLAALNALRREALEKLSVQRQEPPRRRAGGGVEGVGDVLADLVRYGLDLQLHGVHSTSR